MLNWGFPVGPIKLTDEVGIDVGAKVGKIMLDAFGERMSPPEGMQKLMEDERYGRKNGRGFYLYGDKKKGVDESVYEILGVSPTNKSITSEDIAWRCALSSLTMRAAASAKASFGARAMATSARCSGSASRPSAAARSASSIRSAPRRSSDACASSRSNSDPGSRRRRCSKRSPGAAKPSTARTRFSLVSHAETRPKPHPAPPLSLPFSHRYRVIFE